MELDTLNLCNNSITTINRKMFNRARRILNLNISRNQISDIKTGALDSVRDNLLTIDLSGNLLRFLHPGMFRCMHRLTSLDLSSNTVSHIMHGSIKDLQRLTNLDLSDNQFKVFNSQHLLGPEALRKLTLSNNPLTSVEGFTFKDDDQITI